MSRLHCFQCARWNRVKLFVTYLQFDLSLQVLDWVFLALQFKLERFYVRYLGLNHTGSQHHWGWGLKWSNEFKSESFYIRYFGLDHTGSQHHRGWGLKCYNEFDLRDSISDIWDLIVLVRNITGGEAWNIIMSLYQISGTWSYWLATSQGVGSEMVKWV